jgi:hypothetical protein
MIAEILVSLGLAPAALRLRDRLQALSPGKQQAVERLLGARLL